MNTGSPTLRMRGESLKLGGSTTTRNVLTVPWTACRQPCSHERYGRSTLDMLALNSDDGAHPAGGRIIGGRSGLETQKSGKRHPSFQFFKPIPNNVDFVRTCRINPDLRHRPDSSENQCNRRGLAFRHRMDGKLPVRNLPIVTGPSEDQSHETHSCFVTLLESVVQRAPRYVPGIRPCNV